MLQSGKSSILSAFFSHIPANTAGSGVNTFIIDDRYGRRTKADISPVARTQPDINITHRCTRFKGCLTGLHTALRHKPRRWCADQFFGSIPEGQSGRDENESPGSIGLPRKIAGNLDDFLETAAGFHQGIDKCPVGSFPRLSGPGHWFDI